MPRPAPRPCAALILALAAALAGCNEPAPPLAADPAQPVLQGPNRLRFPTGHPQLALLGLAAAEPGQAITVELPGRLVWNEERTQRLTPAFAGRVTAIRADIGDSVRPGSVLARLASPEFGVAQAETARAGIDAALAHKALARQRELFEAGIVARKELEQAEADAARADAETQRARARTQLYGSAAAVDQQLALVAGIAGVVVERNLNPGQELRPDQAGPGVPPLFVLSDPTSLWVQIDARESEAATLQPGAAFELIIPSLPGQRFEGRVTAAADFIDAATRTIKVRGVVANPQRLLKAEMLASVRVQRTLGAGVVVPASAVALRGSRHSVYVQIEPGLFEAREVRVGHEGPRLVVVSQGLEVGEQVVSKNMPLLARRFRAAQEAAAPSTGADGAQAAAR